MWNAIRKWLAKHFLPTEVQEHQVLLIGNDVYVFGESSTRFTNTVLHTLQEYGNWRKGLSMSLRHRDCGTDINYPTRVLLSDVVWALAIQKIRGAKNENLSCPRCRGAKVVMKPMGYLQLPVACPLCTTDDEYK